MLLPSPRLPPVIRAMGVKCDALLVLMDVPFEARLPARMQERRNQFREPRKDRPCGHLEARGEDSHYARAFPSGHPTSAPWSAVPSANRSAGFFASALRTSASSSGETGCGACADG